MAGRFGYKAGKPVSRFAVETTGEPVALQLVPDRHALANDGRDAMPVTVKALDAQGREVPTANLMVHFAISGNASIIGLGNGDPNCHEPEKGNQRSLFNGLAQVIIQAMEASEGEIELTATANGLTPAVVKIPLQRVQPVPFIDAALPTVMLWNWRMSPATDTKPDARVTLSDNDMNSWPAVRSGELQPFAGGKYALFNSSFSLNDVPAGSQGEIRLRRVTGKAEVWLNDQLVGSKTNAEASDLSVPFASGNGKFKLVVLIEGEAGKKAGIGGSVAVVPVKGS